MSEDPGSDERHPAAAEAIRLQEDFPVSYAIFAMARAHRAVAGAALAELGLFPNQDILLVQLGAADGLSQKTLAQTLRVDHSTVAKSVARMERAGLVQRRQSARDRRITLVHLTDAGRALQERILEAWRHLDEMTTAHLTAQDQARFLAVVAKIRPALDDATSRPST